ncbi:hypothetical protein F5Y08DRAFT_116240 [Xylaria arbuscula]|nr:hypothetical protein F5Y08DRAFT_116240 [Xylaria arbuscula]
MEITHSSIGVELEFLIGIAEHDSPMNTPARFQSGGSPLVLPTNVRRCENALPHVRKQLQHVIDQALSRLNQQGDRVIKSETEALGDPELLHLRPYTGWSIGTDPSFTIPQEIQDTEPYIDEYSWFPAEISSPALFATEASWNEIRAVVQAIKDEFWLITPPDAGMHFHYGHGKAYIPFAQLRRIAAFLFAVDPIIVQLHPEFRRANGSSLSNRLYSRLAHGRPATDISREIGARDIEQAGEDPHRQTIPTSFPMPFSRPVYERTPDLVIPIARGMLIGYTFIEEIFRSSGYPQDNKGEARPLDIPAAVHEILQSPNATTVAELMRFNADTGDRPAYSFRSYTLGLYKRMIRSNGEINAGFQNKRTIEFRQMASTMEPEEVVAHGNIVVQLCEFAAEAPLSDFWKVVLDCTVAEYTGDWFDVFDLLAELSLVPEAHVLKNAVVRFRGEAISG